jgi:phosphotransferase system HPr (HPr) family protein
MTTFEKTLTIVNKLGLHARAATKLAQLSQQFDAEIIISLNDKSANAHSIMALMLLAGGQGKNVTIKTSGKDAKQALLAVCQLINDKFDEDE